MSLIRDRAGSLAWNASAMDSRCRNGSSPSPSGNNSSSSGSGGLCKGIEVDVNVILLVEQPIQGSNRDVCRLAYLAKVEGLSLPVSKYRKCYSATCREEANARLLWRRSMTIHFSEAYSLLQPRRLRCNRAYMYGDAPNENHGSRNTFRSHASASPYSICFRELRMPPAQRCVN